MSLPEHIKVLRCSSQYLTTLKKEVSEISLHNSVEQQYWRADWPAPVRRAYNLLRANFAICKCYDHVHIRRYEDETANVPFHKEEVVHAQLPVVGLSLGETRKLSFKSLADESISSIDLHQGDVCIMYPQLHQTHEHAVLPEKKHKGLRINITFRRLALEAKCLCNTPESNWPVIYPDRKQTKPKITVTDTSAPIVSKGKEEEEEDEPPKKEESPPKKEKTPPPTPKKEKTPPPTPKKEETPPPTPKKEEEQPKLKPVKEEPIAEQAEDPPKPPTPVPKRNVTVRTPWKPRLFE